MGVGISLIEAFKYKRGLNCQCGTSELQRLNLGRITFTNLIGIMSQEHFNHDRLACLPYEILVNVMTSIPDLTSLHNFITAFPQLRDWYQFRHKKILVDTVQRLPSLQIQKLICTIISLRNRPDLTEIGDIDQYLDTHLKDEEDEEDEEDENASLLIDDISDPHRALQDIASINQEIEAFVTEFIAVRKLQPDIRPSHLEDAFSSTDAHRMRRALWQLLLFSELFRFRAEVTTPADDDDGPDFSYLRWHLTHIELDEVMCTYYHIHELYGTSDPGINSPSVQCHPAIVQRLLLNLGYGKEKGSRADSNQPNPSRQSAEQRIAEAFSRAQRVRAVRRDMPCASGSNTGSTRFDPYDPHWTQICGHQYGWCMWE